jgi:hypothetical protein
VVIGYVLSCMINIVNTYRKLKILTVKDVSDIIANLNSPGFIGINLKINNNLKLLN